MDDKSFKDKVAKLNEVNTVISKLEPLIQEEAFLLLKDYVLGGKKEAPPTSGKDDEDETGDSPEEMEAFFKDLEDGKPSDNALAIAAFYFSQHGPVALTSQKIKDIATECGRTIPDRVDATILAAKRKGKALFKSAGKGVYKPTTHGIIFFKETYKVKPGKKPINSKDN